MTGDPGVMQKSVIPKGQGLTEFEYDCPVECTKMWKAPITMFASLLHMHQTGNTIWSNLWRNGKETLLNRVEYFQFALQQLTPKNTELLPGDRISVHCVYDRDPNTDTIFGKASTDEMCISYIFYYPRSHDNFCGYYNRNNITMTVCNNTGLNITNPSVKDPIRDINQKDFGRKNNINYTCSSEKTSTSTSSSTKSSSSSTSTSQISSNDNIDFGSNTRQNIINTVFGGVVVILVVIIVVLAIKNWKLNRVKYFVENDKF